MKTSPFGRFVRRYWIVLILPVVLLLAVVVFLTSPFSPTHMCTLMGCNDSLEIALMTEPSQTYSVELTTSNGESRKATCTPGKLEEHLPGSVSAPFSCQNGKVIFYDFTPRQVTIEITWRQGSYSTIAKPTYESFRPNGRYCPPECHRGKIRVVLP